MRPQAVFIGLGLIFLLIGMIFGVWMGTNEAFIFAGAHAHWNLLGFVTSTVYGLIHSVNPELARSRLAWPQCIIHIAGAAIFAPGIALIVTVGETIPAIIGSWLLISGALMFLVMYLRHELSFARVARQSQLEPRQVTAL